MKKRAKKSGSGILDRLKKVSFVRMSNSDLVFFVKRLSFLTKAGIPILDSLHMIREQTERKSYSRILDTVIGDVSNGQYLSTSLAKYKHLFGDFSINIISFGESTGILSENLEYLADELKKKQNLRKKVIGAFIYPAVVTVATIGITGFLIIYLFPKIMPVFTSLHIKLPITTRTVIFLSNFVRFNGTTILLTLTSLIVIFLVLLKKSKTFHFYVDKVLLKTPIIGKMVQYYNLANITRTLGLLLKSGIAVSEAIPIVEKTNTNLVYKNKLHELAQTIDRGEKISVYLGENRDLFPHVLTQIISVGERSGNLSNSLIYLSELYEAEVDDFTKNLTNIIEPMLMIFMGLFVGFIAISIITPIYSITQNLHN